MVFRMSVTGLGQAALVSRLRGAVADVVPVRMVAAPDTPPANETALPDRAVLPGLTVATVNPAIIARYGLPLRLEGVIITDPGPLGVRAGVQRGDILREINGAMIETPSDVVKALTQPGRWIRMDLVRQGQRLSLRFRL